MTKTLSDMTLDELHEEGERLGSRALLALVKPIPQMHWSEVNWLKAELRAEAARASAEAEALDDEGWATRRASE